MQTVLEQVKNERDLREKMQQDSLELTRAKRAAEEELKVMTCLVYMLLYSLL